MTSVSVGGTRFDCCIFRERTSRVTSYNTVDHTGHQSKKSSTFHGLTFVVATYFLNNDGLDGVVTLTRHQRMEPRVATNRIHIFSCYAKAIWRWFNFWVEIHARWRNVQVMRVSQVFENWRGALWRHQGNLKNKIGYVLLKGQFSF